MKTGFGITFRLPVVFASLMLIAAGAVPAQTFTTLHAFTGDTNGAYPRGSLLLATNILYGTTYFQTDGPVSFASGTVFALQTDGSGFTTLHAFNGSDGLGPFAGLVQVGNTLYGTTLFGGSTGSGTVFAIKTDGTGFAILHDFSSDLGANYDGSEPQCGLLLSGNTLYGTTGRGGDYTNGTLFAINTDGTGFTKLHSFSQVEGSPADMILSGNTFYGTTGDTVFKMNTNGTGFDVLHSFGFLAGSYVALSGNTLYGTTYSGGTSGRGTVFAVNTDGTGFTNLHDFSQISGPEPTNSDGANPYARLITSGNTLYGTTLIGGSFGNGTVFAINTDGTGFTNLYNFTDTFAGTNSDGSRPCSCLIISGNTSYGTTAKGGSIGFGNGTVFSISFPPKLNIHLVGEDVVLTWPTNYAGFDYAGYTLQSATNLVSPFWSTNLPAPSVVNGQYTVTNYAAGMQRFFRLSH